jgi:hypothetical protein
MSRTMLGMPTMAPHVSRSGATLAATSMRSPFVQAHGRAAVDLLAGHDARADRGFLLLGDLGRQQRVDRAADHICCAVAE